MFKKTAIVAGLGLALATTAQADYRWELDAGYTRGKNDVTIKNEGGVPGSRSANNDADIGSVAATYYLENVDTSKGPLGEAAFLDHASNITLAYTYGELDVTSGSDDDGENFSVQSRYVAEGPGWKLSGWLFDLGYDRAEPGDRDIDIWSAGIGKYITQNTTLVLGYQNVNVNNGGDADRWGVDLEHFFAFANGGLKARASGGKTVVSGLDDPTTWGLGATWYLSNNLGFGADYEKDDINGFEVNNYRVNVEWFITENFAVDLAYADVQPDDINRKGGGKLESEYEEYSIGALYRF